MTRYSSPCGACKFLRRKCVRGCVFAPYFYHEQGASHFAAIHKVFGSSNVSKLLAHLPVNDRCEAAVTISYEAQARLQDPIYGCVLQIFALQQQVVNLQAQLASLKEQAAQCLLNGPSSTNSNGKFQGKCLSTYPQDLQCWFQSENLDTTPQFDPYFSSKTGETAYSGKGTMIPSSMENFQDPIFPGENTSSASFEEASQLMDSLDRQTQNGQWVLPDDMDDLQSVAFRYIQHS